jgi:hypothetical protein
VIDTTCKHDRSASFDRSLCACGWMHDYCDDCGSALYCELDRAAQKPRTDLADLNRDLTAFEAAKRGWDAWSLFRDSNDNVRPPTPPERAELDALLKEIAQ